MLDTKLEAAAAGLEALMSDLAGGGGGAAKPSKPTADGEGEAAAAAEGEEERGVNPAAEERLGSLEDKVCGCCVCVCGGSRGWGARGRGPDAGIALRFEAGTGVFVGWELPGVPAPHTPC